MKSGFSIPIGDLVAKVKLDVETVARKATLSVFRSVVSMSPVGNSDLWQANAEAQLNRQLSVDLAENAGTRVPSARTLRKNFPNAAGKGYVGGRFKANWNVSFGAADTTTTTSTDVSRGNAEAEKALTLPLGGVMYISNGLPYARRLEYEGWSTQAPAGMVRVSAINFAQYVRDAAVKE